MEDSSCGLGVTWRGGNQMRNLKSGKRLWMASVLKMPLGKASVLDAARTYGGSCLEK